MVIHPHTIETFQIILGSKLREALRAELRLLSAEWATASHSRRFEIAHQAAIITELLLDSEVERDD